MNSVGTRAALIAVAIALPALPAAAQTAVERSTPASGSVRVGVRIAITARPDFVLGAVMLRRSAVAGRVSLDRSGIREVSGDIVATTAVALPAQASFIVTGEAGQSISLAMPTTVSLTRVGGSAKVTVSMTTDLREPGSAQILRSAPGGGGVLSFSVGGRVTIRPDIVAGYYRGLMSATAQYN